MSGSQLPYAGLTTNGIVLVKTISIIGTNGSNPNGNIAGQAGSASTPPDILWDAEDALLWVCTATGSATTAVWSALSFGTISLATVTNITVSNNATFNGPIYAPSLPTAITGLSSGQFWNNGGVLCVVP